MRTTTVLKVKRIDAALSLTQGSFAAAAKLLDLNEVTLRCAVFRYPLLAKWKKRSGYQPRRIGFHIRPYAPSSRLESPLINDKIATLIKQIGRKELLQWLTEQTRAKPEEAPQVQVDISFEI